MATLLLFSTLPAATLGLVATSAPESAAQTTSQAAQPVAQVPPDTKPPAPDPGKPVLPPPAVPAPAQPAPPTVPTPAQTPALTAPAPIPQPVVDGPTISEIVVLNNKLFSKDFIITASGHQVGDPCNEKTLDDMKAKLYTTGYFGMHSQDAEDAVKVHSEEVNGKCRVVIEVDENDSIKGVNITGAGPIKPEEVRKLLRLKQGVVYNPNQFLRDTQEIQDLYTKRGYVMAFSQDSGIDEKGFLNVIIVVTRVSHIKIVKNHKTKRRVILREMRTKEGDYYNRDLVQKDRIRLYNTGLFDEALLEERSVGAGLIDLVISVVEKRTGTISVGVGYSNRQQLVGRAEVTETNFRGMGETVNLLWETGTLDGRSSVELGFTEPYLDRHQTSLSAQLYDKVIYRFSNTLQSGSGSGSGTNINTNSQQYHEQRTGGTLTVSRPFRDILRAAITARYESVRTDPLNLDPASASIVQDGPIYSIGISAIRNTRDLDLDPVTGAYQAFTFQVGHAQLKAPPHLFVIGSVYGNVSFAKSSLEWRQYLSPSGPRPRNKPDAEKSTVAVRLILGGSTGTLPFFEQFFVGGAETLRGYREDRYWGSNYYLASVEYRMPLARRLKGVLFLDSGDAWGGRYQGVHINGFTQSNFSPHFGIGPGIRVGTPLGPIRLDYGFGDEGGRFHFSIGNVF